MQAALLQAEFEKRNGRKGCLDALVFEFGGQWKKGQISRQLKAMGLACGKFTQNQVGLTVLCKGVGPQPGSGRGIGHASAPLACRLPACGRCVPASPQLPSTPPPLMHVQDERLAERYEEVRGRLDCFQLLAEELDAGFTANQVGCGAAGQKPCRQSLRG